MMPEKQSNIATDATIDSSASSDRLQAKKMFTRLMVVAELLSQSSDS